MTEIVPDPSVRMISNVVVPSPVKYDTLRHSTTKLRFGGLPSVAT
jgi:hypothetical protein